MEKIKLGISACLLGEHVRFDSGHKLDRYLTETLGQWVEYVPVGLGCGYAGATLRRRLPTKIRRFSCQRKASPRRPESFFRNQPKALIS